jgi:hypothetical protein
MAAFSGYLAKWVTKKKVKIYAFWITKELRDLSDEQLTETVEVLQVLTGMVRDEVSERSAARV